RADGRQVSRERAERALSRAQRGRHRALLAEMPAPHLARRAILVVVHDAHTSLPRRGADRGQAPASRARLLAALRGGSAHDRRELRRVAVGLRRWLTLSLDAHRQVLQGEPSFTAGSGWGVSPALEDNSVTRRW